MRAVVQRVNGVSLAVDGEELAAFDGEGLLALVGVTHTDTTSDGNYFARKIAQLRLLAGEMSALDAHALVLVVSQFTLYGDTRRGTRPSWSAAAPSAAAEPIIDDVISGLRAAGLVVFSGRFGADMNITMTAAGPVTVIVDSPDAR